MKKFLVILCAIGLLFSFSAIVMADPEYSPWKNETGYIGKDARKWREGWFRDLYAPVNIPLTSFVTAGQPIAADGTTNPGIATTDSIPAIVWATNEVTPIEVTFRVPASYSSGGLSFRLLCSTSSMTTPPEVDWSFYMNVDDTAFDAAVTAQDAVALVLATAATQNEVVLLTLDSTGEAALTAGGWATTRFWNTTTGNGTLEIKAIERYFD